MLYIINFLTSIILGIVGLNLYVSNTGLFMFAGIIITIAAILQALYSARLFIDSLPKKGTTTSESIAKVKIYGVMNSEISLMPSSLLKKNKELNKLGLTKIEKLSAFNNYFSSFYPITSSIAFFTLVIILTLIVIVLL